MALAVLWTVFSGAEYLWKAWPLLRKGWAPRSKETADAAADG
jgi:CDP-diacylglycerol--glycerol-3-phosphate 3-phosphatidyltransferase